MAVFDTAIFSHAAILTFGLQTFGFLVAYLFKTEVFYDIFGGINYQLLALLGFLEHPASSTRYKHMTAIFAVSRGWLLVFLAWRAHSRKGDARFHGIKDKFLIFWAVWMAQAAWVFLISWPLLAVQVLDVGMGGPSKQALTTLDIISLVGFAWGVGLEIVADVQKALWVQQGRPGGFCRVGAWKFSRHPNYFGEIFQMWCSWGVSYGSLATTSIDQNETKAFVFWGLGILSPLFTMNILLNMSGTGVWNAEGGSLKRYYESEHGEAYREYRANTSPLIPMVGYRHVPLWIKRTFLFEWKRFEYRPCKKE